MFPDILDMKNVFLVERKDWLKRKLEQESDQRVRSSKFEECEMGTKEVEEEKEDLVGGLELFIPGQ